MDAGSTNFTVTYEGKTYVTEAEALGKTSTAEARELIASLGSFVEANAQLKTNFTTFEVFIGEIASKATALSSQSEALMNGRETLRLRAESLRK